jgi:hypothetical protein
MSDEWTTTTGGRTVSRTSDRCGDRRVGGRRRRQRDRSRQADRVVGVERRRRRRPVVETVGQPVAPVHDIAPLIDDRRRRRKKGRQSDRFIVGPSPFTARDICHLIQQLR